MKLTLIDKVAWVSLIVFWWVSLIVFWVVGIFTSDYFLIGFSCIGMLQFALAVKIVEAIKGEE